MSALNEPAPQQRNRRPGTFGKYRLPRKFRTGQTAVINTVRASIAFVRGDVALIEADQSEH